ncbi:hypothetical protein FRB94_014371, partial [Tulasnella sp. JGI-2019a]
MDREAAPNPSFPVQARHSNLRPGPGSAAHPISIESEESLSEGLQPSSAPGPSNDATNGANSNPHHRQAPPAMPKPPPKPSQVPIPEGLTTKIESLLTKGVHTFASQVLAIHAQHPSTSTTLPPNIATHIANLSNENQNLIAQFDALKSLSEERERTIGQQKLQIQSLTTQYKKLDESYRALGASWTAYREANDAYRKVKEEDVALLQKMAEEFDASKAESNAHRAAISEWQRKDKEHEAGKEQIKRLESACLEAVTEFRTWKSRTEGLAKLITAKEKEIDSMKAKEKDYLQQMKALKAQLVHSAPASELSSQDTLSTPIEQTTFTHTQDAVNRGLYSPAVQGPLALRPERSQTWRASQPAVIGSPIDTTNTLPGLSHQQTSAQAQARIVPPHPLRRWSMDTPGELSLGSNSGLPNHSQGSPHSITPSMDWTPVSSQSLPLTPVEPGFSSTQVPVSSGPSASPAALSVSQPQWHTAMQHQLPKRPAWLPPSPALTVSASPVSPIHTSAAKQPGVEGTTPHQSLLPSDKNLQHKSKNAPKLVLHSKPSSSRTSSISMGSTALDPDVHFLPKSPATATLSTPSGNKGSANTIVTGLTLVNHPPQSGTSREQDSAGATNQSILDQGGAGPSGKESSAHLIARPASAEVLSASPTLEPLPTPEPTKTTKRSARDDEDSKSEARVDDAGRPSDRKRMKLSNDGAAPIGVDELGVSSADGDVAMTLEDHAASASGVRNQVTASPSEPTLTPSNLLDSRGTGVRAAPGQTFILCGPQLTCTTPSVPVDLDSKTLPMEVREAPRPVDTAVLKQGGEVTRRSPIADDIAELSASVVFRSPIPKNPSESAYSGGEGSSTKENEATQADGDVTLTRSLSDTARSAPPEEATPLAVESPPELAQAGTHNVTPKP